MAAADSDVIQEVDLDGLPLCASADFAASLGTGYPRPIGMRAARALVLTPWRAALVALVLVGVVGAVLLAALTTGGVRTANSAGTGGASAWRIIAHLPAAGVILLVVSALLAAGLWRLQRWASADHRREARAVAKRAAARRLAAGYGAYLARIRRSAEALPPLLRAIAHDLSASPVGMRTLPLELTPVPLEAPSLDRARPDAGHEPAPWFAGAVSATTARAAGPRARGLAAALDGARLPAIVVVGPPGAGKSALLRQLAAERADAELRADQPSGRVPFYLNLGDKVAGTPRSIGYPRVDRLIADYLHATPNVGHLDVADRIQRALLTTGPSVLIFDGLDDLTDAERAHALVWLNEIARAAARLAAPGERPVSAAVSDTPAGTEAAALADAPAGHRDTPAIQTPAIQVVVAARATSYRQGDLDRALFEPWEVCPFVDASARANVVGDVADLVGYAPDATPRGPAVTLIERLTRQTGTAAWAQNPRALTLAALGWMGDKGARDDQDDGADDGDQLAATPTSLCADAVRGLMAPGVAGWRTDEVAAVRRVLADVALDLLWVGAGPATRDQVRRIVAAHRVVPDEPAAPVREAQAPGEPAFGQEEPSAQEEPGEPLAAEPTAFDPEVDSGANPEADPEADPNANIERDPEAVWTARGVIPDEFVLERSCLFVRREDGRYDPADARILEFLAAEALARGIAAGLPGPRAPEAILGALEGAGWLSEEPPIAPDGETAVNPAIGRSALDVAWRCRGAARWSEVLVFMVGVWMRPGARGDRAGAAAVPRRPDLARAWVRALLDQPSDPGLLGLLLAARTVGALAPDDEDARVIARDVADRLVAGRRATLPVDTADLGRGASHGALARAIAAAGIGAGRDAIIETLRRQLRHPDAAVRAASARAAGILGAPSEVSELVPLLADDDARVRRVAAGAIGACGPDAAHALPRLRDVLADAHREVRRAAALAIGDLGAGAVPALPALVATLTDPDAAPREAATWAIAALGTVALPALPDVAALLDDPREPVRVAALEAITGMGVGADRALPRVRPLLDDDAWTVRRAAVAALGALGHARPEVLPALRARLTDPDADVRRAAAWTVARLGPDAASLLPTLRARMTDPDFLVRQAAVQTIGALGVEGAAALPAISQWLTDPAPEVRAAAARAAAASVVAVSSPHHAGGTAVLADLNRLLVDPSPDVRGAAGEAITRVLGADAADVLPDLRHALDIPMPEVRLAAVATVGALGEAGTSVVPTLIPFLTAPDSALRQAVVGALAVLGPEAAPALPELRRLVGDGDVLVREAAVRALGALGPAGAEAVEDLRALLDDGDAFVREAAARALGTLGPVAVAALPDLLARLADRRRPVRRAAAEAIAGIRAREDGADVAAALAGALLAGDTETASARSPMSSASAMNSREHTEPAVGSVLVDLLSLISDADVSVRQAAGRVLRALGTTGAPAIPDLRARLTAPPADTRRLAAEAVGALGSAGVPALPELLALLADPDEAVRRAAMAAIGRLGAEGEDVGMALMGLRVCLGDASPGVRQAAAAAIGSLGPGGAPACADLASLLTDAARDVRRAAAAALGNLGPASLPAVPALVAALADPESDVTGAVAHALAAVRPEALKALVGEVQAAVADGRARGVFAPFARRRELDLLQAMGPAAWVFEEAASVHLADDDWSVRRAAAQALGAMGRVSDATLVALTRARSADPVAPVRTSAAESLEDLLGRFPDLPG